MQNIINLNYRIERNQLKEENNLEQKGGSLNNDIKFKIEHDHIEMLGGSKQELKVIFSLTGNEQVGGAPDIKTELKNLKRINKGAIDPIEIHKFLEKVGYNIITEEQIGIDKLTTKNAANPNPNAAVLIEVDGIPHKKCKKYNFLSVRKLIENDMKENTPFVNILTDYSIDENGNFNDKSYIRNNRLFCYHYDPLVSGGPESHGNAPNGNNVVFDINGQLLVANNVQLARYRRADSQPVRGNIAGYLPDNNGKRVNSRKIDNFIHNKSMKYYNTIASNMTNKILQVVDYSEERNNVFNFLRNNDAITISDNLKDFFNISVEHAYPDENNNFAIDIWGNEFGWNGHELHGGVQPQGGGLENVANKALSVGFLHHRIVPNVQPQQHGMNVNGLANIGVSIIPNVLNNATNEQIIEEQNLFIDFINIIKIANKFFYMNKYFEIPFRLDLPQVIHFNPRLNLMKMDTDLQLRNNYTNNEILNMLDMVENYAGTLGIKFNNIEIIKQRINDVMLNNRNNDKNRDIGMNMMITKNALREEMTKRSLIKPHLINQTQMMKTKKYLRNMINKTLMVFIDKNNWNYMADGVNGAGYAY